MACFIAPATEAVITTIAQHIAKKHEKPAQNGELRLSERLGLLNRLLWGGSALLAFEHVWHGELSPKFPFLTGEDVLHEILTNGIAMALLVTAVWGIMLLVLHLLNQKKQAAAQIPMRKEETV